MKKIYFEKNYVSYLLSPINANTNLNEEVEIELDHSPNSDLGFLIIDKGDPIKEESIFYHRRDGNKVYAYGINRNGQKDHDINSQVLLVNSIDAMNYLAQNTFEQMYIFKVSDLDVMIIGGSFFINGENIEIEDLNTSLGLQDKTLENGETNYIHIKNNDYYISTTKDTGLYLIGEITKDVNGQILDIKRYNTFPISGKVLDDEALNKLSGIEEGAEKNIQSDWNETNSTKDSYIKNKPSLLIYEKSENKKNDLSSNSTTYYPTIKAVNDGLENKVDKVNGKGLSTNDFTNYYKDLINNKVDKINGKGLSTNDFTNELKDRLENIQDFKGIDLVEGNNVEIEKTVDQNGKETYSISSLLSVTGAVQSRELANINPVGTQGKGAKVVYDEWDRYLELSGTGLTGFDGKVRIPDATTAIRKIRVLLKNPGQAGNIKLQLLIKVISPTGQITKHYKPVPFNKSIGTGETYFDIDTELDGLDVTNQNELYFNITRDARIRSGGVEDTVNNEILVSSTIVYFNNVSSEQVLVLDVLNSNSTTDALSANQGRILNETKADINHNHDGVYEPVFNKNTAFNKNFGTGNNDVARGDHTHTGLMSKSTYDTNDNGIVDNSEKLNGQEASYYLDRNNHTGQQAISTITNLQTELDLKADKVLSATDGNFAGLDTNGNLTDSGKKASDFSLTTHNHNGIYEPVFNKNTAFNKNFGTGAGEVMEGNTDIMKATWGKIEGTLSDQTDLQNALDGKANLSGGNTFNGDQVFENGIKIPNNTGWTSMIDLGDGINIHGVIIADTLGIKFRNLLAGDKFYFRNSNNKSIFELDENGVQYIKDTDIIPSYGVNNAQRFYSYNGDLYWGNNIIKSKHKIFTQYSISAGSSIQTGAYCHQGFTKDEQGNFYFIDTQVIKKYNPANDTELASEHPASGLSGNHYGDGKYYKGKLYVPYESYSVNGTTNQKIIKINPDDLSYEAHIDLNVEYEISGVSLVNDKIYVASYNGQGIQVINMEQGFYKTQNMGLMQLDFYPIKCQSIDILGDKMILHTMNRVYIYKMIGALEGKLIGVIHNLDAGGSEGIFYQDENTILLHKDTGNSTSTIYTIDISNLDFSKPVDFNSINIDNNKSFGLILPSQNFKINMEVKIPTFYNWVHLWESYQSTSKNKAWFYENKNFGYRFGTNTNSVVKNVNATENTWMPIEIILKTDTYGRNIYSAIINGVNIDEHINDSIGLDILFFGGGNNKIGKFYMKNFNITYLN